MRPRGLLEPTGRSAHVLADVFPAKASTAKLRGHADLSTARPRITDQLVGSCASNAVPQACAQTLAYAGKLIGFEPSVADAYRATLALRRAAEHPLLDAAALEALFPLTDTGSQLLDVVAAVERYGLGPMGTPPVEGVYTDCDLASLAHGPTHASTWRGRRRLVAGCYPLDALDDVAACLEAGIVVAIGGFVSVADFEAWTPEHAPIGVQHPGPGGGHATRLDGYAWVDAITGRPAAPGAPGALRVWRGVNSWGERWGDRGCYWCTDAFVAGMWERYACDARLVGGAS